MRTKRSYEGAFTTGRLRNDADRIRRARIERDNRIRAAQSTRALQMIADGFEATGEALRRYFT